MSPIISCSLATVSASEPKMPEISPMVSAMALKTSGLSTLSAQTGPSFWLLNRSIKEEEVRYFYVYTSIKSTILLTKRHRRRRRMYAEEKAKVTAAV